MALSPPQAPHKRAAGEENFADDTLIYTILHIFQCSSGAPRPARPAPKWRLCCCCCCCCNCCCCCCCATPGPAAVSKAGRRPTSVRLRCACVRALAPAPARGGPTSPRRPVGPPAQPAGWQARSSAVPARTPASCRPVAGSHLPWLRSVWRPGPMCAMLTRHCANRTQRGRRWE